MSTLTITSPGVQINEVDLSVIARPIGTTDVLITGFTNQGPTEEFTNITSVSEFEDIFGVPTNSAERYLYHSAKQILNTSPANLLVSRLPYGTDLGSGYANSYSALVYPISTSNNSFESSNEFLLLEPKSVLISEEEYTKLSENNVSWSTGPYRDNDPTLGLQTLTNFGSLSSAGLIVLNSSKTSVNNLYEGYYVGICDNSNINPATNFNAITGIKAATTTDTNQSLTIVDSSRLNFTLTQQYSAFGKNSISEIIETYPTGYDFASNSFKDSLILVLFKLRTSIYNQDTVTLDFVVSEGYAGSLYANRTQNNPNGGAPNSFFLENVVNKKSNNIKVIVNPYLATTGAWTNNDGTPAKTVKVADESKNLYSAGVYISETDMDSKDVGNIPNKLQRVLSQLQNTDTINIDVVAEAGLGTIWASAEARSLTYPNDPKIFDDTYHLSLGNKVSNTELYTNDGSIGTSSGAGASYLEIANQFVSLANDSRRDHVFIADPLRNIFVQGSNGKISSNKGYIFADDIFWPIKNQFGSIQSSYVVTYGNWIRVNDTASDSFAWVPSSGFVAAKIAQSSQQSYPWSAVAGFSRGTLSNVIDLAINPTQKQRDQLYKINVNPIAFFPNDGFVIYGQKTLYRKPSAFDRLNVRRLFLTLEKSTQGLLRYFVFEPNTFSTRQRLIGSLSPIFDKAKINDGLYDYTIVCDERNNTPDTIDNNELRVSIYIQPVRTAEFILADFIATRTGIDFNEIIG